MVARPQFMYIHESHLDLFWIGDYRFCLERGRHVIKQYIDRCLEHSDESFLLETVVFLEHFLRKHPDYRQAVLKLWHEGRLDVGAAYIDILEHLVLAESQIHNIVRGKRWCLDRLGIDTRLAAHADLPSLAPQMPQIYRKAGIAYYATSRKVFPNGQVWVHVAPDGTTLRIFNHPLHYDFHELRRNAAALNAGRGWQSYLDPDEALKGFPLGKVVLSAGAADQADMECFKLRYGRSAREFVEVYGQSFPEYEFRFGTVSEMMREYEGREDGLPHLTGEIPSVWGMTSVPSSFFQRGRRLEGQLLTAEFLAALQRWYGLEPISAVRDEWFGTLYERLYFLDKDPVPRGAELDELWKMHLFVLDHNFSGNFASQTAFDKRTIQQRALSYAGQMVDHGLACLAGPDTDGTKIVLFNPLNWPRTEPVELELASRVVESGFRLSGGDGQGVTWQAIEDRGTDRAKARVVAIAPVPAAGYAMVAVEPSAGRPLGGGPQVSGDEQRVTIETDALSVAVDRAAAALTGLRDRRTGAEWGSNAVGKLYAVREAAFDVPLGVDESDVLDEEAVHRVDVSAVGPVFARVTITKSILKAHVTQEVTVWQRPVDAVDVTTTVLWHGEPRVQMRLQLPTAASRQDVFYGTPFYGSNWRNVVPGSGPRNPDEMACLEHWHDYRELQLWIHQRRAEGALMISSLHPTYHWGRRGLEAVLMRTTPSCADDRFFWEHAGRCEFAFRFRFAEADVSLAAAARMGQQALCPVVVGAPGGSGLPWLLAGSSLVEIDGPTVVLSAVCPDPDTDGILVRFFEAAGREQTVDVRVRGAVRLEQVDFLGVPTGESQTAGDSMRMRVGPWQIVTLRALRYGPS